MGRSGNRNQDFFFLGLMASTQTVLSLKEKNLEILQQFVKWNYLQN